MSKSHSYFELLDAFKGPGCPICNLVVKYSRSYLHHLMYESVLDVPTRMKIMESFGFCNWHTWQLLALPPVCSPDTGFSIFASDLLRKFDYLTRATAGEHRKRQRLKSLFRKVPGRFLLRVKVRQCPACSHVVPFESYRLRDIADFIGEEEFQQAYRASQGICLPHFFLLRENYAAHPNFLVLSKLQLTRGQSLRDRLEEFIRKQDYRFRDEITSDDANAWKVAIEHLAGKPGVFANEMGHDLLQRSWRDATSHEEVPLAVTRSDRFTFGELIAELKTAKQATLYLKQPLPKGLFDELREVAAYTRHPVIEAVVEDIDDVEYLRNLHSAGFSLFYGIGLPLQTIILLDRRRGFLLEENQQRSGWNLRLLKNAEELYLSLLWRRFGVAVVLSGSIKETDKEKKLFSLIVEGRRQQWCRFKGADTNELPEVGTPVEVFAWEKWNSHILEALELRVLEAGWRTAP